MRNLCREVIEHERITTSEAKAKAVKPKLEKLITLASAATCTPVGRRSPSSARTSSSSTSCSRSSARATRAARRLRADRQARSAQVGLDRDGLPRAGLGRPPRWRPPLDISYDGSRFTGWAKSARPAHGPGRARGGGRKALRRADRPDQGRADRRRRPRDRPGRQLRDAPSRPIRCGARSTRSPERIWRSTRPGRSPTGSAPAAMPRPAVIATGSRPRRSPSPFERGRVLRWPYRSTGARRRLRRGAPRQRTTSPPSRRPTASTPISVARSSTRLVP